MSSICTKVGSVPKNNKLQPSIENKFITNNISNSNEKLVDRLAETDFDQKPVPEEL